jgi:hypothetical protein
VDEELETAQEVAKVLASTTPGREGLEWLGDLVRGRRARSQVKILAKTRKAISKAGLSPHVVPDKTLVPLLECLLGWRTRTMRT